MKFLHTCISNLQFCWAQSGLQSTCRVHVSQSNLFVTEKPSKRKEKPSRETIQDLRSDIPSACESQWTSQSHNCKIVSLTKMRPSCRRVHHKLWCHTPQAGCIQWLGTNSRRHTLELFCLCPMPWNFSANCFWRKISLNVHISGRIGLSHGRHHCQCKIIQGCGTSHLQVLYSK